MTPTVAILNRSSVFADADLPAIVAALQVQVSHDFAPLWGLDARLRLVLPGQDPAPDEWWLAVLDDADQAGALGYHETTPTDLPIGKVFARTVLSDGGTVSVTLSHELLEMLADPHIQLAAVAATARGTNVYAYEDCDACESDQFAYGIGGVKVSDFVTPAWFDPGAGIGPYDFCGHIAAPLQLLPGGYIGVLSASNDWQQLTADGAPHHSSAPRYAGNRWHRRKDRQRPPSRSTAHSIAIAMSLGVPIPGSTAGAMA